MKQALQKRTQTSLPHENPTAAWRRQAAGGMPQPTTETRDGGMCGTNQPLSSWERPRTLDDPQVRERQKQGKARDESTAYKRGRAWEKNREETCHPSKQPRTHGPQDHRTPEGEKDVMLKRQPQEMG